MSDFDVAPVRVNLIAAGFVDHGPVGPAPRRWPRSEARATAHCASHPPLVGPGDVAALAKHLMTNTALTGATYDVDGGQQLVVAAW